MTISVARNFLTSDEFKSLDSVQELVDSNALTGTVYLKSYYDGWQSTLAGPKGGHFVHRTGATAAAPTVGSPVAPGTIGTGAQAGYYWSQDGFEWTITPDQDVTVEAFGAQGDGTTDDTAALINAFIWFAVGKKLHFGKGKTYLFNPIAEFGIDLNGVTDFSIEGNYSTIQCINGAAAAQNGVIFWFENCEDGEIKNLFTDGNLANRTGNVATGAHNIKLRNANKRLKFINCKFLNAVSDGFYIDADNALTPAEDIELIDCEGADCFRGNISIIDSERFKMRGGSTHGASGSNPQHGIDFEDDNIYGNKNFLIEDVDVYGNDGEGIQISGTIGVTTSKLKNVRLWDNGKGDDIFSPGSDFGSEIRVGLFDGLVMEDIYCKGNTNDILRGLVDFTSSPSTNLVIRNLNFKDANPTGTGVKFGLYLHSSITGEVDISGITADGANCIIVRCDVDDATIDNVVIRNTTAGNPISIVGDRPVLRNIKMFNNALGCLINGTAALPEVDGFHSVDCAGNYHLLFNGADAILRNAYAIQTTSIPAGQNGFTFAGAPLEISNVRAKSAGTDYTGANVISFSGGLSGSSILNSISPGHWTSEQISSDQGDANKTLVRGVDEQVIVYNTPITAVRTVSLPSTNIRNGDRFKVIRTAAATGAFNLVISTVSPSNKTLAAGQYVVVQYNGASWVSVENGSI